MKEHKKNFVHFCAFLKINNLDSMRLQNSVFYKNNLSISGTINLLKVENVNKRLA